MLILEKKHWVIFDHTATQFFGIQTMYSNNNGPNGHLFYVGVHIDETDTRRKHGIIMESGI